MGFMREESGWVDGEISRRGDSSFSVKVYSVSLHG